MCIDEDNFTNILNRGEKRFGEIQLYIINEKIVLRSERKDLTYGGPVIHNRKDS